MTLACACVLTALPASGIAADMGDGYHIDWYVISGGGYKETASLSKSMRGSIAQPVIGMSTSASFELDAGFWVRKATPRSGAIFRDAFEDRTP